MFSVLGACRCFVLSVFAVDHLLHCWKHANRRYIISCHKLIFSRISLSLPHPHTHSLPFFSILFPLSLHSLSCSPDFSLLVSSSHDGTIKTWRTTPRHPDPPAAPRVLAVTDTTGKRVFMPVCVIMHSSFVVLIMWLVIFYIAHARFQHA